MTDYNKANPTTGKPWTVAEMQAQIAQLEKQNAELAAKNTRDIRMSVSEGKGTISLTGVNARFPVSLHYGQWQRIFAFFDLSQISKVKVGDSELLIPERLANFAKKHEALISAKDDTDAVQASKLALRKASTDPDVSHAKEQKETK